MVLVAAGAALSAAVSVSPASASFHLMKVREVYPGSVAASSSDYVVLQMTAQGQNFVNGHKITLYNAAGSLSATVPMNKTLSHPANQSTILLAGSGYAAAFPSGPAADFSSAALSLSPAGGAVCYPDGIPADCVSWGSFTPPALGYPSASTPNASPGAGGITDGMALRRSISAGCATLLEPADDTNSSAADFAEVTPAPRANSTPPSEHACPPPPRPQTRIVSGPKGRTADRTPTFRFSSSLTGGSFRCKLDRGAFARCTSPKTYGRLGFGPHSFQVKAVKAGRADLSPAKRSFRVVRPG